LQPLDAERVKEWRHRRMLSQQEVADRAGTSLFTIQRIERGEGNVRPKTGRGVAAALGIPIEELLPKNQAPLPFSSPVDGAGADEERQPTSPAGWQTLAKRRSELLEEAAELWDTQLERGQYDWQTLKAMESVGFRLALNHTIEARAIKQWLTADQLAQLEHAEKRYGAHARKIVGLLRRVSEEEKKKLSEREVVHLERYISQREAALQQLNLTA
jgi:transcriptional regulator with XRE-family HTH domain